MLVQNFHLVKVDGNLKFWWNQDFLHRLHTVIYEVYFIFILLSHFWFPLSDFSRQFTSSVQNSGIYIFICNCVFVIVWHIMSFQKKNSLMLWSWARNKTFSLIYRNYDGRSGKVCHIIVVHFKLLNALCQLNDQCRKPLPLIVTWKLREDSLGLGKETAVTELKYRTMVSKVGCVHPRGYTRQSVGAWEEIFLMINK